MFAAEPLRDIPEVRAGDDLTALLLASAGAFAPTDVLCIAHKVVSKAEGAVFDLDAVVVGDQAAELAAAHDKDPALMQVVLDQSASVLRADRGRIICETHHGFVCANAGVDQSNTAAARQAITLPVDPDGSARRLRAALGCAVVITDSFGRAWRMGQCEVAIGCAGLAPLEDWRGRVDSVGHELHATVIAIADEAAAAADLVRTKDSREPAIVLRGLERWIIDSDGPGAAALRRFSADDLFR